MAIINKTKGTILAKEVVIADQPLSRIRGLLGRKGLKENEAMIIKPCNSIHTFFMRFTIDCLFVDKNNKVVKSLFRIPPWRLTPPYFSSYLVIELPAGTIASTLTQEGDTLVF